MLGPALRTLLHLEGDWFLPDFTSVNKGVDLFGNKNQVEGSSINVSELSAHAVSSRALCAGRSLTFMTGVILIITLARFVTQFVSAELKIMVSYTVLKIIRV